MDHNKTDMNYTNETDRSIVLIFICLYSVIIAMLSHLNTIFSPLQHY